MYNTEAIAQPTTGSNLAKISSVLAGGGIDTVDVAAAYALRSGVVPLVETLKTNLGLGWSKAPKRWLFSFDMIRSEPTALDLLAAVPASKVRIYDGAAVLARRGAPRRSFHPKSFLLSGADRRVLFAGSGNVSRSGLIQGHEVGVLVEHRGKPTGGSKVLFETIATAQAWFNATWKDATLYDANIAAKYRVLFDSLPHRKAPALTDDDLANFHITGTSLSPTDLAKLRVCTNLWIDAGNITKNRGKHLPGNQLMMKRMTRVFFDQPANDVPENTSLATLEITFAGTEKLDCSLTYSDNKMDKLTLPVPEPTIPTYDGRTLLFRRAGGKRFELDVLDKAKRAECKRLSSRIGADFRMSGPHGREWGVF